MRCLCALSCTPCSIFFHSASFLPCYVCLYIHRTIVGGSLSHLRRRLGCFQRRSCITTRFERPSFIKLLVRWIKWASNDPFTEDLGPRGCFQCHSNRKAWILFRLCTTTAGFHGLHPVRVVDFAPPTNSPLCWRSLLVKSHVMPLYVHP